jgi:hypothetical protein
MHSPALKPYSTQVNEIFNLPTSNDYSQQAKTHNVYQKYFRKLAEKFFELVKHHVGSQPGSWFSTKLR